MLNVLDEFTLECLAIRVDRKLKSTDVIDILSDLFILRGVPEHVRSDNGPEFVAKAVQDWIAAVGAKILYADPPHAIWYAGARHNPVTFNAPHDGVGRPGAFGPKDPVQVDFVTGCSMLIPRQALAQVGLFDEQFFAYAEDYDWCLRAQQRGLLLMYVPQAVLYHKVSASIRRNTLGQSQGTASARGHYLVTRNFLWVVRKHAKPWQTITAISIRMIQVFYHSAGMIVLQRWEKLCALWRGVRDGLVGRIARSE